MSEDKRSNKISNDYGAEQIQVLEGLEPVRKRPGMYIGSTGPRGLHHLVYEVVDNSVDEALAGHCDHIEIVLRADGSASIADNGRGIPTDIHPRTGKSALETVLTVLHAGGKFGSGGYKVSGGLHGVGISVVNALSEWVNVTVYRNGSEFNQRFEKGVSKGELETKKQTGKTSKKGTTICFKPDKTIFSGGIQFEYALLSSRLRELAYLNGGVKIVFRDERNQLSDGSFKEEIYLYQGGIKEYVEYMNVEKESIHPEIIYVDSQKENVYVEAALQWCSDVYSDNILGFANNIRTIDGGTHIEGLKTVLTRTFNNLAKKRGKRKEIEKNRLELIDSGDPIGMNEEATAVRKRKNASINVAMDLVRNNRAEAVYSAGNSGAMMASAIFRIGRLKGIDRPAIGALFPTRDQTRPVLVLDVGANTDCKPSYLHQFALLGNIYAKDVLQVKKPRIGLLNIGEEECKGNDLSLKTFQLLSNEKSFDFAGNCEGRDVLSGSFDVVVCDGFTGNILLKFLESVGGVLLDILRSELPRGRRGKVGSACLKSNLLRIKKRLDHAEHGGA